MSEQDIVNALNEEIEYLNRQIEEYSRQAEIKDAEIRRLHSVIRSITSTNTNCTTEESTAKVNRSDEELKYWIEKLVSNTDTTYDNENFIEWVLEELEITREKYLKLIAEMPPIEI